MCSCPVSVCAEAAGHEVEVLHVGRMKINGNDYVFENAVGYWEGDSGVSFPKEYLWTQVAFNGGSLMLSVADIPFGLFNFTGIIGVINYIVCS